MSFSRDTAIEGLLARLEKPIVLTGMMGTGKSHLGRKLAMALGYKFYDTDKEIETRAGCTVSEIFQNFGEMKFREAEENIIQSLLERKNCVIATGGGAVLSARTRTNLSSKALTIWIDSSIEDILKRVGSRTDRPLLQTPDKRAALESLMNERRSYYEQADIAIRGVQGDIEESVNRLIESIFQWTLKS